MDSEDQKLPGSKNGLPMGQAISLSKSLKFIGIAMKKKTIEIPDFYVHDICESGAKFMEMYGSIVVGSADRYIYAKKIVEKFQGDDLVQFIAEMLLSYDGLRFKYISADKDGIIHSGL